MTITFAYRPSLRAGEITWTVDEAGLSASTGQSVPFSTMRSVRFYDAPGMQALTGQRIVLPGRRCVIRVAGAAPVVLTNQHVAARNHIEDRSEDYLRFVWAIVDRVLTANPQTKVRRGMPVALLATWWLVVVLCGLATAFGLAVVVTASVSRRVDWEGLVTGLVLVVTAALSLRNSVRVVVRQRSQVVRAGQDR